MKFLILLPIILLMICFLGIHQSYRMLDLENKVKNLQVDDDLAIQVAKAQVQLNVAQFKSRVVLTSRVDFLGAAVLELARQNAEVTRILKQEMYRIDVLTEQAK